MNVKIADVLAKIPDLLAGFEDHVHLGEIVASTMLAEVESFSTPGEFHQTSIRRGGNEGELDVTCGCVANKLCRHITAFYAVAKKDDLAVIAAITKRDVPPAEDTPPPASEDGDLRKEGLRLIAQAQEKFAEAHQDLVDGIVKLVKVETV